MVVRHQASVLSQAGHEVQLVERATDDLEKAGFSYRLKSGLQVLSGLGPSPLPEIESFRPDIVHVHNLFPNFGSNWLKDVSVPIVTTLHNFRTRCANGLFFREGHNCFDCLESNWTRAIRHSCYHGSRIQTLPVAFSTRGSLNDHPMVRSSSLVFCLSDSAADFFVGMGLNRSVVAVLPNPTLSSVQNFSAKKNGRWVVVSRLSPEKGVLELVRNWPSTVPLDVVGDGPDLDLIMREAGNDIRFLGRVDHESLLTSLSQYNGLIMPSLCLEMQPTTVIEAFSAGIPVLAHRDNAAADLVVASGAGAVYWDSESLTEIVSSASIDFEALGVLAREYFDANFTNEIWLSRIEAAYTGLIERSSSSRQPDGLGDSDGIN